MIKAYAWVLPTRWSRDLEICPAWTFCPFQRCRTGRLSGGFGKSLSGLVCVLWSAACPWRIDMVAVKRSEPRSAQQSRTQTADDLIGSFSLG